MLNIPLGLPLAGLFIIGVCAGSLVNLAVYRLAWHPRSISPWSGPPSDAPPRRWYDRVPIVGWLGLRQEADLHGRGFWIRPMLVEVLCGIGFAALYWWEIDRLGLLPPLPRAVLLAAGSMADLHVQYACHLVLISLMLIGSLIDIDEKTIPDTITLPGTLFGLVAAAVYPWSLLPDWEVIVRGKAHLFVQSGFLHLASPRDWPPGRGGFPEVRPLLLALGCWWLWCVALMPRTWYSRHGWLRACQLCWARLRRELSTWWLLLMGLIGSAGIAVVWLLGGLHWPGLLSALVGLAAGGGLIWATRIIATAVLRREAMGFGDVTLMAMIGVFLGWQPCLMVFFLAPFAALVVGFVNLILHRQAEIYYGPFLCLAALVVIVRWAALWEWATPVFGLGLFVPLAVIFCLALMAPLLGLLRLMLMAFRR